MFKISDYDMDKVQDYYNGKPQYEKEFDKAYHWLGLDPEEDEEAVGKYDIWWGGFADEDGFPILDCYLFSFDKNTVYDLYRDYPSKLTEEERKMFREDYPDLAALRE